MLYIITFAILAWALIIVGRKLSIYGDKLGDLLGMEKSWIGLVMLAAITSLPELVTSLSATYLGKPEMAISNIFGSNMFNIFVVFIIDIFILRKISLSSKANKGNIVGGIASILLTILFLLGFLFPEEGVLKISIFSFLILGGYFLAMRVIYLIEYEKNDKLSEKLEGEIEEFKKELEGDMTISEAKKGFILAGLGVVILGILLSFVGDAIAVTPIFGVTLGSSFVGTILIALATSLPELTVSIEAVKLKAYDMAVGNLIGSNIFNIAIVFIVDLFYRPTNVYKVLEGYHAIVAIFSILLLGVFLIGILWKGKKRKYDSYLIGVVYILGMLFLYIKR